MGTDLENTIERLEWQTDYYIECCNPTNEREILEAQKAFIKILRGE